MAKRFYMNRLAIVFSTPMTMLALIIFAIAWMENKTHETKYRIIMAVLALILLVIMFFYYRYKFRISSVIRKAENVDEYEKGGMLERSFILEDRMLAGCGFNVSEQKTTGIRKMSLEEKGRKIILHLTNSEGTFDMQAIDKGEAERFAAFMKRKNPDIILNNVTPKGNGTLKELGAGVTVSPLREDESE